MLWVKVSRGSSPPLLPPEFLSPAGENNHEDRGAGGLALLCTLGRSEFSCGCVLESL